jgi:hypothetical protein
MGLIPLEYERNHRIVQFAELDSVIAAYGGWGKPFAERPDVTGDPGGYRGGPLADVARVFEVGQRPHRPAEVVEVREK